MFFKKKPKTFDAIVMEKRIIKAHDSNNELQNLYQMKRGTYNTETSLSTSYRTYEITFMTQKGKVRFFVEQHLYQQLKLDSLVELTTLNGVIQTYKFHKIATKIDVQRLNW